METENNLYLISKETIKKNVAKSDVPNELKTTLEIFANRFNEELYNKEIKQEAFAKELGIAPSTLSNYRCGKRFPDIKLVITISEKLEVSLDYLFGINDLKSKDIEFKKINEITGLSDDAINTLKMYFAFINDDNSLEPFKSIATNRLKAINYLISQENEFSLFSTIAYFLWYDYKGNGEKAFFKNLNIEYNSDITEEAFNDMILLQSKNQDGYRVYNSEDINKLDFILIEEKLTELKKKYNKENDK